MSARLIPQLNEFAPARGGWAAQLASERRLSEQIAHAEGYGAHTSAYGLFEEMEDKDPHLFSLLQTRRLGVLARPRRVEAAGAGERERAVAEWVGRTLESIPEWQSALLHLLDAMAKGMAVVEIIWGFDAEGKLAPRGLKPRAAGRFARDGGGGWRLVDELTADANAGLPLPPRKFIIALFGASDERPYGKGLCERVYWNYWFKKNNVRFWIVYNEKFGAPTVIARHRPGISERERDRLLEVIESIQHDAGVTLPDGMNLELLEAKRSGSGDNYRALAQWCNDEMARAILGQTLTSGEGDRSGSLALARVHEAVRRDYVCADARMLMDVVNEQLVRPLVGLNFGENVKSPRWTIDLSPELDLTGEVTVDRQLLQMGVPLPLAYFHEKYGRPAPTGDEPLLRNDDSNVFQYHLQFGILTVNEVRHRLGLAPVPWGDRPTSPGGLKTTPPPPGSPAGEDLSMNEDESETARLKRKEK